MRINLLFLLLICVGLVHAREPKVSPTKKALQCAFQMETDVMSKRLLRTKEDVTELLDRAANTRKCNDEALVVLPKTNIRTAFSKVKSRYALVMSDSSYEQEFKLALADLRAAAE